MHKLMEFICDELEELERKAEKEGKLSMQEVQYLDTLAHTKKNLLKADEMWDESEYSEYSMARGENRGGNRGRSYAYGGRSYARGDNGRGRNTRRDSMGRYSRDDGLVEELHDLMEDAPNEQTKQEFRRFISKIESMQ